MTEPETSTRWRRRPVRSTETPSTQSPDADWEAAVGRCLNAIDWNQCPFPSNRRTYAADKKSTNDGREKRRPDEVAYALNDLATASTRSCMPHPARVGPRPKGHSDHLNRDRYEAAWQITTKSWHRQRPPRSRATHWPSSSKPGRRSRPANLPRPAPLTFPTPPTGESPFTWQT